MPSPRALLRPLVFILLLAAATAATAATFVVPADREIIRRADAVVIATPLPSYAQLTDDGGIETITPITIERTLRGPSAEGSVIDVVEPGGTVNGQSMLIPGAPQFEEGRRVLLFLQHVGKERWAVTELVLGKFTFATDVNGHEVLVRDEDEIVGWDSDLKPHDEKRRLAVSFLDYVTSTAGGKVAPVDYFIDAAPLRQPVTGRKATSTSTRTIAPNIAPYTATSYTMFISGSEGGRWAVFPNGVTFFSGTTQEPGAPGGGVTAINTAFTSWDNDCGSNVNYVYGGTDNGTHTQGLHGTDGANTILFERDLSAWGVSPFTCSSSGYSGTLGLGGITSASGTNSVNGETFATTQEADVEMNRGIANCTLLFNNGDWNSAVTHEVGHTLGFRHADQTRDSAAACTTDASLECSSNAIMKSFISTGLNGALQAWDQHAVQAVYPGNVCAPNSCTAPGITGQPTSRTITSGSSTTLSVTATGTAPLSYQWYIGASGNTASPVSGGTGTSLTVSPAATTSYWVRVSNSCGSVNSSTATVTVTTVTATASSFYLVTPCRLIDTRNANGPYGGPPIGANSVRNIVAAGHCGIPTGTASIALNVTVIAAPVNGWMILYPGPAGTSPPNTATINFTAGKVRGNNAIIPLGSDGSLNVINDSSTTQQFVIDVTGYFK
jgi:hypothetical protein